MPKVKIKRKSTSLDMAPMCDMAFLLLTFFILTSNFIQKEVVQVNTPSSISEIKIPERNVIQVFIDQEGKVFFGTDGQKERIAILQQVGDKYNMKFTDKELKEFSVVSNFGLPMEAMKSYLAQSAEERDSKNNAIGIPSDSLNNQLKDWIEAARAVKGPDARIAIKADAGCKYPVVKNVMNTMRDLYENRYNLITSLEENPEKVKF